jgi:hypothetical protein
MGEKEKSSHSKTRKTLNEKKMEATDKKTEKRQPAPPKLKMQASCKSPDQELLEIFSFS